MSDILGLLPSLAAGLLLGAMFFGGLWWTIRKALSSRSPASWFLSSLLLRSSLTVIGFYWVSGGRWENLLACVAGFIIARLIVTRLTRPAEASVHPAQAADHAP
jgi:F1F0 ATPase subunit 2